ncbi:MAG: phosphoglucosamine mutase [Alphaproteobacteria bacterium]|nr:phosphoglucosamine mutase [Alphaproteobacteria bacterium]
MANRVQVKNKQITEDIVQFGTDGIRGRVNSSPMTAAQVLQIAEAVGLYFQSKRPHRRGAYEAQSNGKSVGKSVGHSQIRKENLQLSGDDHRPLAVIGKDTRLSGYMLEPALTAGLVSVGMDVTLLGPMPTPAVAMLTRSLRADLGIMLSASHNPHHDNGIKLFGPDGNKLSDESEAEIAALIQQVKQNPKPSHLAPPDALGRARRLDDAAGRYIEFVKASFPRGMRLDGLKVAIDCAHGAAYRVAPRILWELGAEIIPLAVSPDGLNINHHCGSTDIAMLSHEVVAHKADLGLALDGDADRLIVVDENGAKIDGDQIMGLIARNYLERGLLTGGGVVSTIMSNLGFEQYLRGIGLDLIRANVGDRHVLEAMRRGGYNLGGEPSGHIILSDYATTGDGMVAALQFLACLQIAKIPASQLARVYHPFPQIHQAIKYQLGLDPLQIPRVKSRVDELIASLGSKGRAVVRKSGTEPVIRVMVEAENENISRSIAAEISSVISAASENAPAG